MIVILILPTRGLLTHPSNRNIRFISRRANQKIIVKPIEISQVLEF